MSEYEEEEDMSFIDDIDRMIVFGIQMYNDDKDSKVLSRIKRFEGDFKKAKGNQEPGIDQHYAKLIVPVYKRCSSKLREIEACDEGIKDFISWLATATPAISIQHDPNDVRNSIPLSFIATKCIKIVKEKITGAAKKDVDEQDTDEELIEMFTIHLFRIFGSVCPDSDDEKISNCIDYLEGVLKLSPGENPDIISFLSSIMDDVSKEIGNSDMSGSIKKMFRGGINRKDRDSITKAVKGFMTVNRKNGNPIQSLLGSISGEASQKMQDIMNNEELMHEFLQNPNAEKFTDLEEVKGIRDVFAKMKPQQ